MTRNKRVIGGAGTGKTRLILSEMGRAREELGLSPEQIGFTTFTRNGRKVMAERAAKEWGCSETCLTKDGNFKTAHATCRHQLGITGDQLLTNDIESQEWISQMIGADLTTAVDENNYAVFSPRSRENEQAALALNAWNFARNTLTPLQTVITRAQENREPAPSPEDARIFVERYESAKHIHGRVDFTDLLGQFAGITFDVEEYGLATPRGETPEGIRAVFVDEAQDASALVDRVCRRLAAADGVDRCIMVGDSFQSILGFAGSDYRHFEAWKAQQEVMPQSYRCPPEIMELGERCLSGMHEGYWDRGIKPASHSGVITQVGDFRDAIEYVDLNESTLILSRCKYIRDRYAETLRIREIPYCILGDDHQDLRDAFHTLWQLQAGAGITHDNWSLAIQLFPEKSRTAGQLLEKGKKEAWLSGYFREKFDLMRHQDLEAAGCTPRLANAIRSGDWLELTGRNLNAAELWVATARRHGPELARNPKIQLATIHSAKGAEGSTVILATETVKRIEQSKTLIPEKHDEECRIAYVGVTRASHKLIVVQDAKRHRMYLPL